MKTSVTGSLSEPSHELTVVVTGKECRLQDLAMEIGQLVRRYGAEERERRIEPCGCKEKDASERPSL